MPNAQASVVVDLMRADGVTTLTIGRSRTPAAIAVAGAVIDLWTLGGGRVVDVVSWDPDTSAWADHARRMVRWAPDAWVVVDSSAGWGLLVPHLTYTVGWDATRTYAAVPATTTATDLGLRTVDRGGAVHAG